MFQTKNLIFKDFLMYDDIHILKSKVNFIKGSSGSGKSTLLKMFNKTENFSNGEILYKGKPLTEYDSIALRKEVKLISQTAFLFSGTIKENFDLFYKYCERQAPNNETMLFFLKLAITDFSIDTLCDNLSGGEKQRVYIAICLSMGAEIIMLDEPTSALDSELANKLLSNIINYCKAKQKTLVIISHDANLIENFSENIIELSKGGKSE